MRKIANTIVSIGAAVAVMAALCAGVPSGAVAKEKAESLPSAASAPQPKSKTAHVRQVRGHPARFAALARQGCGGQGYRWQGSPCDRPVLLILGIGF